MSEFNEPDMIECYFDPQVAAAIWKLRQDHRIKLHHDYAFTYERKLSNPDEHGVRVFCLAVYNETSETQQADEASLSWVVVGDDFGGRIFYSMSGQWSESINMAMCMTLADAQAFVERYPDNNVRLYSDFAKGHDSDG